MATWEDVRRADFDGLGNAAPKGAILGARVEHEGIGLPALQELIEDAWLACAPKRLASSYLKGSK